MKLVILLFFHNFDLHFLLNEFKSPEAVLKSLYGKISCLLLAAILVDAEEGGVLRQRDQVRRRISHDGGMDVGDGGDGVVARADHSRDDAVWRN